MNEDRLLKHSGKYRSAALICWLISSPASAQWVDRSSVDSFTDEKIVMYVNDGKILEGPTGSTNLVYRIKENDLELFWSTPDDYICDFDKNVMVRYDEQQPTKWFVNPSKSKKALFAQAPLGDVWKLIDAQSTRLLLEDGCGSRIVAEFDGPLRPMLQELAALESTKWKLAKGGFIEIENASSNAKLKYRPYGYQVDFVGSELILSKNSYPHQFIVELRGTAKDMFSDKKKGYILAGSEKVPATFTTAGDKSFIEVNPHNKVDGAATIFTNLSSEGALKVISGEQEVLLSSEGFKNAISVFPFEKK